MTAAEGRRVVTLLDSVVLICSPLPGTRTTMPPVRTVPASKSMQSHVIAHTSPIRRPVASIIETKSGRSRLHRLLVVGQRGSELRSLRGGQRLRGLAVERCG